MSVNDSIAAVERRCCEDAENFARANVGLEGLKPSKEAEARVQRHIDGEIQLADLVQQQPV